MIKRRLANSYVSSLISTSLVLFLVGVTSMLLVNARSVSDYFKENLQISVLMKPEVSDAQAMDFQAELDNMHFIKSTAFVSCEQGTEEMKAMLGEDFMDVFNSIPVPASIDVTLQAEYVSSDSVAVVRDRILESNLVDEVEYQQSLIEALNANLRKISMFFAVFIALLLFISFVLINNTVRLSIFSRRFSIHTMKLVGATRSFIREPFLLQSVIQGFFASVIATVILLAVMFFVRKGFVRMFEIFRMELLLAVIGIMIVSGIIICMASTCFAVNRMVSLTRDELYY